MTRKRTLEQNRQLHRLITVLGYDDKGKADLVSDFTFGRETSSKEMTEEEARSLIGWLLEQEELKNAAAKAEDERLHGKSRGTVRHYLHIPPVNWSWQEIEDWVKNRTGKRLDDLGGRQLNNIVSQAKAIYRKEVKAKIQK